MVVWMKSLGRYRRNVHHEKGIFGAAIVPYRVKGN
jgi:hypothetical protein